MVIFDHKHVLFDKDFSNPEKNIFQLILFLWFSKQTFRFSEWEKKNYTIFDIVVIVTSSSTILLLQLYRSTYGNKQTRALINCLILVINTDLFICFDKTSSIPTRIIYERLCISESRPIINYFVESKAMLLSKPFRIT